MTTAVWPPGMRRAEIEDVGEQRGVRGLVPGQRFQQRSWDGRR
jgi:hypothetical protein